MNIFKTVASQHDIRSTSFAPKLAFSWSRLSVVFLENGVLLAKNT